MDTINILYSANINDRNVSVIWWSSYGSCNEHNQQSTLIQTTSKQKQYVFDDTELVLNVSCNVIWLMETWTEHAQKQIYILNRLRMNTMTVNITIKVNKHKNSQYNCEIWANIGVILCDDVCFDSHCFDGLWLVCFVWIRFCCIPSVATVLYHLLC